MLKIELWRYIARTIFGVIYRLTQLLLQSAEIFMTNCRIKRVKYFGGKMVLKRINLHSIKSIKAESTNAEFLTNSSE